MRCGVTGVSMSEDMSVGIESTEASDMDEIIQPSEDKLELAERILTRLKPPSRTSISRMIHTKAKTVGGIFAGYAVFWWLTVLQVDNEPAFESIFFGPEFLAITILAPSLIFLGSLFSDFSRELGQLFPGLASGVMFVLAVLYTFEPIVRGSFTDDLGLADAIWKSTRLAVMCTTVLIAAKLLIDAWLLGWVKVLMENYPDLDFSDNGSELAPVDEEVYETEA